ncbi:hypothetical protein GKZ28_28295, partial [Clostridium chromiireducens]
DAGVVSVDVSGKITGVSAGTAVIKATTADGSKTAVCVVTVTDAVVNVRSVNLNKTIDELTVGGTDKLEATVNPSDATNKAVTWSSDNTSVATVDVSGKITGVSAGTAVIKATTVDGGKVSTCTVTVSNALIKVESI